MQDAADKDLIAKLPQSTQQQLNLVREALASIKSQHLVELPIMDISDVADCMVLASGTSSTHVKAIAERLIEQLKENDHKPTGVEGLEAGEWVLVDMGDIIVHVMLPAIREFYELEKLWTVRPNDNKSLPSTSEPSS